MKPLKKVRKYKYMSKFIGSLFQYLGNQQIVHNVF